MAVQSVALAAARKAAARVARDAASRGGDGWKKWAIALLAATFVACFALTSTITGITALLGGGGMAAAQASSCGTTTGDSVAQTGNINVTAAKKRNVEAIVTAAKRRGLGEREMVLGVMVAIVESELLNVASSGNGQEESQQFPNDGVRPPDHQSVGLFQQQPWWGSMEERMTPELSAGLFYDAMKKVSGWQTMPLGVLAQRVQVSAYPDRYGAVEATARGLVAQYADGVNVTATATPEAGDSPEGGAEIVQADLGDQCGDQAFGAMTCEPRPDLNMSLAEGMTPDGLRVLWCGAQQAPEVRVIGTIGQRPRSTGDDHATGKAVDFMIEDYRGRGGQVGDRLAVWMMNNASALGVKYVIWDKKIWNKDRDGKPIPLSSWRAYNDPTGTYTDTTNHYDHVHVSVFGNAATAAIPVNGKWTRPMLGNYTLSSAFGMRFHPIRGAYRLHAGIDMAAPIGDPVVAASAGTVRNLEDGAGYGHYVVIDHGGGTQTLYGHLSRHALSSGTKVKAGQVIGYSGNSGGSTGPHLHFEVRKNGSGASLGTPLDPAPFMADAGAPLQCAPGVTNQIGLSTSMC